jgi:hypothetical protein
MFIGASLMSASTVNPSVSHAPVPASTGAKALAGATVGAVAGAAVSGPAGAIIGGVGGGLLASLPIVEAIRLMYGTAKDINGFIDDQIEGLKTSAKESVQVCGKILEGVKNGFGIGYISSAVTIAAGHLMLGNVGLATATAISSATFTNPLAMTCGAIGAIYFGWGALDTVEKNAIIERLVADFKIGVELVKAIVNFVVDKMKAWTSSDTLEELKNFVKESAASFGKSLSEITRNVKDRIFDTASYVKEKAEDVGDFVKENVIDPVRNKFDKKDT